MTRWWVLFALVVPGTARASSPASPAERARAVVDAQLAVIEDPAGFIATLAPDAVILGNGSFTLASGANAAAIVRTLSSSPRSRSPVTQAQVTRIDAGGSADVVWLGADIVMMRVVRVNGRVVSRDRTSARLTELVVADGATWKIVALSFASTSLATAPGDSLAAPGSGPLTAALASLRELDRMLSDEPTTIVLGPCGELGVDPKASHRVLVPWRDRDAKVTGAIEIRTKTWGIAAGEVVIAGDSHAWWRASPMRVQVFVFAIPDRRSWKVVVANVVRPDPVEPEVFVAPQEPACQ